MRNSAALDLISDTTDLVKGLRHMAIVLALLITGWLIAFAVGAQTGFESSPEPAASERSAAQPAAIATSYSSPASAS